MNSEFSGLTLNKIYFQIGALIPFCKKTLQNEFIPEWEKKVYQFIIEFLDDKKYIEQKTSGTTGSKKTLQIPKKSMIASAKLTEQSLDLKPEQSALLCLPIEYIAGKMMVVRSFVSSLNLILTEPKGNPELSDYKNIDFSAMIPLQVYQLSGTKMLQKIKTLIIGGAELNHSLEKVLKKFPNQIYETYGMAETCSHIALRRINGKNPDPFFKTLPGIKLDKDKRGCLIIMVPFLNEKIITNDLVELIGNNQFQWLGRYDNIINSGGIKIQPEFLEKQIQKIINLPCILIGLPDPIYGQILVMVVEGISKKIEKSIIGLLENQIDRKLIPKKIITIEKFPRNDNFKIDRKKLIQIIKKDNR